MKHIKLIFALIIAWMMGANAWAAVGDIFTQQVNGVNMQFKVFSENGRFERVYLGAGGAEIQRNEVSSRDGGAASGRGL